MSFHSAPGRHRAAPDDLFAALDRGGKDLVLEIAVGETCILDQPQRLAGFA